MKKLVLVLGVVAMFMLAQCGAGAQESNESEGERATPECPRPDAADATAITQERADMLIGLTESDAESCAIGVGWAFRVGERDRENFAVIEN